MTDKTPPENALDIIRDQLPVASAPFDLSGRRPGLVIVDEVNGFATVGAGPLAPARPNARVERMVAETDRLARAFAEQDRAIAVFLDTHEPGRPEPPYPPHCEIGSGQEELVPALAWLEDCPQATLLRKDCINGFIGAIDRRTGENGFADWIGRNQLDAVVVVGICTDICVMDFVLTVLSARNHGLLAGLRDIVVLEGACATYDLSKSDTPALGLPETAAHPQSLTHHLGLYFMASRGAVIASAVR